MCFTSPSTTIPIYMKTLRVLLSLKLTLRPAARLHSQASCRPLSCTETLRHLQACVSLPKTSRELSPGSAGAHALALLFNQPSSPRGLQSICNRSICNRFGHCCVPDLHQPKPRKESSETSATALFVGFFCTM